MIEDVFNSLTYKERLVIWGYFLLGMNQSEIARDLGISRERVRQLKDKAVNKLELEATLPQRQLRRQGYIKLLSLGPSPTLVLCDLAENIIQELKPYTLVKVLREDKPLVDSDEKRQKFFKRIKERSKLAKKYGKFTSWASR